jgi:hypothetical protein
MSFLFSNLITRATKNRKEKQMNKIKIENNVPGLNVTVNQNADGSFAILLAEQHKKVLGNAKPGEVVKIGNREYIVLGHAAETTAVITKEFATKMEFGSNGDYLTSKVRKYCNGDFYKELAAVVGKENIIKHTVNLEADDGTGKGKKCQDDVSIITTENYRRYREILEAYGDWWWTATRVTFDESAGYARYVCCVSSYGILDWFDCGCCLGVRPFCILNSSISVS